VGFAPTYLVVGQVEIMRILAILLIAFMGCRNSRNYDSDKSQIYNALKSVRIGWEFNKVGGKDFICITGHGVIRDNGFAGAINSCPEISTRDKIIIFIGSEDFNGDIIEYRLHGEFADNMPNGNLMLVALAKGKVIQLPNQSVK
jgi:hypothetical protein